jgi:ribose transport system ATP-binding protein
VGSLDKQDMSIEAMRRMMIGREISDHYFRTDYERDNKITDVVLRGERLSSDNGIITNLDIELHRGEILGIGGLANSGMHELGKMLYGICKPVTGKVTVHGTQRICSPRDAIRGRVGYIAKDRDIESLIINASIKDNMVLPSLDKLRTRMLVSSARERKLTDDQIAVLHIKCVDGEQLCSQLSGGNKQKVALGKWLANDCDVLIMDCPTRGIDIGVKATIYDIMCSLKNRGKSILMISEELVELIGMSDRMLIMKDGKITADVARSKDVTESMLIEHMI